MSIARGTRALTIGLGAALVMCGATAQQALADTLEVGPGKAYATPCAALGAAGDGDVIAIDASGSYDGDVCAFAANGLVIRGVGGRAHIDAAGQNAQGKAIWVIQGRDTTIEDIELSGCEVPDDNGAGIRQEGANLTLRRVYLHDNQNGILTGANADSVIVIEDSELARNGAGDGYSHNAYIGEVKRFELRGSYSHDAKVGHLVKSRAHANVIVYNRLSDENGTASYEIDLPQGGASVVLGNVIQQSATTENSAIVSYAREATRNPDSTLVVASNTFFNARGAGTFVVAAGDLGAGAITLRNNVFAGPGTIADPAIAIVSGDGNWVGDPGFVAAASWDFHLADDAPARDSAVAVAAELTPACQYAHPAHAVARVAVGTMDPGAFELGPESTTPCGESVVVAEPEAPVEVAPETTSPEASVESTPETAPETSPDTSPEPAAEAGAEAVAEASSANDDGCAAASQDLSLVIVLAVLALALVAQRAQNSRMTIGSRRPRKF